MKIVLIILVLAIVGIGAYFVLGGPAVAPVLAPSGEMVGDGTAPPPSDIPSLATPTVIYTDAGFGPATLTVNVGDTVRFVNNSSHGMWVASDVHPSHTEYDGTTRQTHCATGGSFDQCVNSAAGASYEFTFTKAGTFGYHNHVGTSDTGTVIVK